MEKINIYKFIEEQYWGYRREIARHIGKSDSWITQSLRRSRKHGLSKTIREQIVEAINIEENTNYTHKDFIWHK